MAIKDSFDYSKPIMDEILIAASSFISDTPENKRQFRSSIHPHVANALFHRTNEIRQDERMKTLIILSRTLDDANLEKAIEALNYEIIKK